MIKKLSKCVRGYKLVTILTPIFMVFEVTMEVTIPFIMGKLIDNGIEIGNMTYITKTGLLLIGLALLSLFFGVLSGTMAARASAGFSSNLRKEMFESIQKYSFSNIDKFSVTSIVTRLTTDIFNVNDAFHAIIRQAVRAPIMLIFALVMAFNINGQLALIYIGIVPILGFGLFFIISKVHPIFVRVFKTYDTLNRVVQENLRGIRVVKSFVREENEISKFQDISKNIYQDFSKAEKRIAFNSPLMQFCIYSSLLLISWFGAKLIINDQMSSGNLMSMINYTMLILMSLMGLSMVFVTIMISYTSAKRIIEIIDEKPDITNNDSPIYEVSDGSIVFNNVNFSYTNDMNKLCLSNININIKSGETIGIIGGTGSSKSSLVQLIPRLYDITSGELLVGGINVKDYDINTLRENVSVVLQKNILFSGTIKENLLWGDENASETDIINACKIAEADGFIKEFPLGYDTYIEQGGSNVSGGQKQRLCIARALLKKPKILILDDSTSAVDTKTDASIRKALKEVVPHITKIIIAQRVASIMEADRIIVIDNGIIQNIGTHLELLSSSPIYQEVYESQTLGGDFDE